METEQSQKLLGISENVVECWVRIKSKARARGDITNIEKHAPCITSALNQMQEFLHELEKERLKIVEIQKEHKRLAREIPLWGTDGD